MKITVTTPTGNIGRVLTEKLLGGDAEITLMGYLLDSGSPKM